jgi:ketosteroid isomerase-like protein
MTPAPSMRILRPLLFIALFVTVTNCRPSMPSLSSPDVEAIRSLYSKFSLALLKGDLDSAVGLLATDVWLSQPNQPAITGRDSVMAWARTWPKVTSRTTLVEEVAGYSDLAYARTSTTETYALPNGSLATEHFTCIDIVRRQPGGAWLVASDICHPIDRLPSESPTKP